MAFDVAALTTYIENDLFKIMSQMQATGGLAEVVDIQTGIKKTANLHFMDTNVVFQADGCSNTPIGTTTFTDKSITVGAIAVAENLCTKDLNGFWEQTLVKKGRAGEEEVPGEIEKLFLDDKSNGIANQLAISDFQGDTASGTANLNKYDGLLKLVDADATVIDGNTGAVTVATGITSANILAIVDGMWESIPENIFEKTNLSLWVPITVWRKYVIGLKNANLFHYEPGSNEVKVYGTNVALRPTIGLPGVAGTERMILTHDTNIVIGMDGDNDEDSMKAWFSMDDNINKFRTEFKRGVQFRFGDEIVEFTLVP